MRKITCLIFIFITTSFYAQVKEKAAKVALDKKEEIRGFKMYPNPVTNGKLYISALDRGAKHIQIFNILGKSILTTKIMGKELNISKLTSGVYILKVIISEKTITRKLVVK
ncbi:T9SS type A sorting domain-containing protein [Flavobacteriaceae bacterium F08102]|nr:T9SS type A sorting domain-containing protein [Flavobacteriaceae bacterium F08102]